MMKSLLAVSITLACSASLTAWADDGGPDYSWQTLDLGGDDAGLSFSQDVPNDAGPLNIETWDAGFSFDGVTYFPIDTSVLSDGSGITRGSQEDAEAGGGGSTSGNDPTSPGHLAVNADGGQNFFFNYGGGALCDFNGDGIDDFADHATDTGSFYVHLGNGSGGFNTSNFATGSTAHGPGWEVWMADFDGDGLCDFADHLMTTGQFWIHHNNGNGTFSSANSGGGITETLLTDDGWEWSVGDFNGDGRADYVERYRPTGDWYVHQAYPDGGFAPAGTNLLSGTSPTGWNWFFAVSDVDHDGLADIVNIEKGDATPGIQVFRNLTNTWPYFVRVSTTNWPQAGTPSTAPISNEAEVLFGREFSTVTAQSILFHYPESGQFIAFNYNSGLNYFQLWGGLSGQKSAIGNQWDVMGTPHAAPAPGAEAYVDEDPGEP